ncbi:diacylglycerol/lipid kinase family protein [Ancylobacter lacus]|uniref:diacylglycerol/lipid kinase family protein n=1 Tax=Ancylobacter lacus TaxID=2579970 RepID=UPI001BCBB824|nr:diacylglycerol kinase family protein [Ancylobacter lacus]MBS7540024.1 diacylglycerol kinase [Ancylobacter lacus]
MRRVLVLINANAGTVLDRGADTVTRLIEEELGDDAEVELRMLSGTALLDAIRGSASGDHDAVVVGGGDGSVSLAVQTLAGTGRALGILPLGTMNLLATDLGMPRDLGEAIAALGDAHETDIDVATLNGRAFHTISGIGFFSQMARAREAARHWKLGRFFIVAIAAFYALRRSGRVSLDVTIDGETRAFEALAALVTVNRFSGPGWRRARLDEGLLEIHVVEERGALARLKAGADMVTDSWRDNPGIISLTGHEIAIARSRRRSWVSTDGELDREKLPLTYAVQPGALRVLMPPRPPRDG